MKTRWIVSAALLLCGASFLLGQVLAQESGDADKGAGAGQMQPPAWTKKTQEHADFTKSVGTWDAQELWSMGGQEMKSTGVATAKLALGGYFIEQTYKGTMAGTPWEGRLYVGYDTVDKQFVAVWLNSMSPIISISRGTEKDGVLVLKGKEADYMDPKGAKKESIMHLKWLNDDAYRLTFFEGEKKMGQITYTRRK